MLLLLLACAVPVEDSPSDSVPIDPTAAWIPGSGPPAIVSGRAFVFGPPQGNSIAGATVTVVEAPEVSTAVEDDGSFVLEVPTGAPLTFRLDHGDFASVQSATLDVPAEGLELLGFQVPTPATVDLMSLAAQVEPDPERCQVATTVSASHSPPYGGSGVGEPGATVSVLPTMSDGAEGPIYFAYVNEALILPDPTLTETTIDGGVLFGNLSTGDYTLRADKPGVPFTEVSIRCRPGALINASPPWGIEFDG